MGHLTNAKGFRVGKVVAWDYTQHRFKGEGLKNTLIYNAVVTRLRKKLRRYFRPSVIGLVFSHCQIRKYGSIILIRLSAFNGFFDTYLRHLRTLITERNRKKRVRFSGAERWKRRVQKRFYYYFYKLPMRFRKWFRPLSLGRRGEYRKRLVGYRGGRFARQYANKSQVQLSKMHKVQSRFKYWTGVARRRGHPIVTKKTYNAIGKYLSRRLTLDFRNVFLPRRYRFIVTLSSLNFLNISARILAMYVLRRIRLGFKIPKIVIPLLLEAKKNGTIKGLFFKFKGRYSRKPRSVVNKMIFRYGKIGFSTVTSKVDYSFLRFETKFGTCSIKVWLAKK